MHLKFLPFSQSIPVVIGFVLMSMGGGFTLSAALPNPDFADEDGDGIPDGWEVSTFILEDYRGIRCLSLNYPRHSKMAVEGSASTVFSGSEGFYRVTISYLDEFDGVSKGKFLVNDEVVKIWDFDNTFGNVWCKQVIENVELKPGDKITIFGRDNPTEYCRIRSINIEPSPAPPSAEELAERRNPPKIEDREFGSLVALRDVRDLSAMQNWPEYQPLFLERSAPILVLKKAGEPASLELEINRPRGTPQYSVMQYEASTSARELVEGMEGTLLMGGDLPFDEMDLSAAITLPEQSAGLIELRLPNTQIQSEVPHVLLTQTEWAEKNRGGGSGAFYFFVPRGTETFGIGAYSSGGRTVEVTVFAPDGSLVTKMDVPPRARQGLPFRVPPGQDDSVWTLVVSGVSPTIRLVGIPPYLATHPKNLLVPQECVTAQP